MWAEAWWAKQGRRALFLPEGVKFSGLTYIFCVTNRFKNYRRNAEPPKSPRTPAETENKVHFYVSANER